MRHFFAGMRFSENVAAQHDSDLNLLRFWAFAIASLYLAFMLHIMLHCAHVSHIERARLLGKTDAVWLVQFHFHCAASKNSQRGMQQRRSAISVPAILPSTDFHQLNGCINERIICKILVHKWASICSQELFREILSTNFGSHTRG